MSKQIRISTARKANTCSFCPNTWGIGDEICILSDPITDRFDLICTSCGKNIESTSETNTLLKQILEELKKLNNNST